MTPSSSDADFRFSDATDADGLHGSSGDTRPADEADVKRLRAGDPAALERIYRTYVPQLLPFAFRYVRSREEAEEIVQSVFERLWRERTSIVIRGSIAQYLFVAVRSRAHDRLRHDDVVRRWHARAAAGDEARHADTDADARLAASDVEAAITRALAELPERRRTICTLRWIDGLTYTEIANRLGISDRTVETQLARAVTEVRARVKALLG